MNDRKSTILAVMLILFLSCNNEEAHITIFSVDIAADSFPAEGGSKSITLASNVSWHADSNQDWLSVTPTNGLGEAVLILTATANSNVESRAAIVTVTPRIGDVIRINISQATNHQFQVDAREVSFDAAGGEATITVTSTSAWETKSSADWLIISPTNGTGDAVLTLTTSQNNSAEMRTAMVTLIPEVGKDIKIPITQKSVVFSTDVSDILFSDTPGEKTITLFANTRWEAQYDSDWLTIDPEKGTGQVDEKLNIEVRRNVTGEERSARITLTPEIGTPVTISVLQKASNYIGEITRYVAPNAKGDGSGNSEANAADFLSANFWSRVNGELKNKSVEVLFLPGNYERAYTSAGSGGNGLIFDKMGDEYNRLILTGGEKVIFTVPEGYAKRNTLIRFHGSQNITFRDFNFTGNGEINYVLAIRTPSGFPPSKNISIENCTWVDMLGIVYGATGCHYTGTANIIYRNCTFKRIGLGTGSHMMYHAYGPTHVSVIDSYFENCTGEYVRFRDRSDYAMVKNCTFNRHTGWIGAAFISVPNYNDENPGNEYFGTNFSFTGNLFQNSRYGIQFRHTGFSPTGYNYLLTAVEGTILENGSTAERAELLKANFGLDVDKIRIENNGYPGIYDKNISINSGVMYGAISLGWTGTANITSLFNVTKPPFDWEIE